MKADLKDITFLILVRLDSIDRLENIVAVTDALCRYFDTNIVVTESDSYSNGVLKKVLNRKVEYHFHQDSDPVLYKTRLFNQMAREVKTPFIAIWDADSVVDRNAIERSAAELRAGRADVALPYNTRCLDVPKSIKRLYFQKKDIRVLFRHRNKMDLLYDHMVVGGAIFIDIVKYKEAGMENEQYYGWGSDDFDRFRRFRKLGYKIYIDDHCLFHLSHSRGNNSRFISDIRQDISKAQLRLTDKSTPEDLLSYAGDNQLRSITI